MHEAQLQSVPAWDDVQVEADGALWGGLVVTHISQECEATLFSSVHILHFQTPGLDIFAASPLERALVVPAPPPKRRSLASRMAADVGLMSDVALDDVLGCLGGRSWPRRLSPSFFLPV